MPLGRVSLDAATAKTSVSAEGVIFSRRLLGTWKHSAQLSEKSDVAYKFLIFDYNQHEIYAACKPEELKREIFTQDPPI